MTDVRILCGANGSSLAEEISGILSIPAKCVNSYADWAAMRAGPERGRPATAADYSQDSRIEIPENVRGRDVYVIQSTCSTPDEHSKNIVELMLILTALRRSAARRVYAVIPYFAYCRQTQKRRGREPISGADVSMLFEDVGVDHVITVDIFREQTAGFFSPLCAFDSLSYLPVSARFFWKQGLRNPVVVAPHASTMPKAVEVYEAFRELHDHVAMAEGGAEGLGGIQGLTGLDSTTSGVGLQREMWDSLSCASSEVEPGTGRDRSWTGGGNSPSLAMLLPVRRDGAKIMELTGDVEGRDCVVVDDIIDSGSTVKRSTDELLARGARSVSFFATHGLFSDDAFDIIEATQCRALACLNPATSGLRRSPARSHA